MNFFEIKDEVWDQIIIIKNFFVTPRTATALPCMPYMILGNHGLQNSISHCINKNKSEMRSAAG